MNQLKKYLIINALFSVFSGSIMIFFRKHFNQFFNIENNLVFTIAGSSLLLFGVLVFYTSQKHTTNTKLVNTITFLNVLWVIGSIITSFFGLFNLSDKGYLTIMIVAICVGYLAAKQFKHNKSEKIARTSIFLVAAFTQFSCATTNNMVLDHPYI